jgi:hypothetical protein
MYLAFVAYLSPHLKLWLWFGAYAGCSYKSCDVLAYGPAGPCRLVQTAGTCRYTHTQEQHRTDIRILNLSRHTAIDTCSLFAPPLVHAVII